MYKHEFPDFDYELMIPKGWEDCSWHNDVSPHIEKSVRYGTAIIWEDYADESLRECGGKQFYLYLLESGEEHEFCFGSSDDFNELLAIAEKFLEMRR